MRILLATPLLLVGACNVQNDPQNNQVMLEYNEEAVQNAAEDVGNTAENIGVAIGNEVEETADKIDNSGIVARNDTNTAQNKQ